MTVEFVCETCDRDNLVELTEKKQTIICTHCGNKKSATVTASMSEGGKVDRCVICDRIRFYVQKDFNPRLGILIFAVGVLLSYHTYLISLFVATLIDFILYKMLNTVTICYHCRAVYRGFEEDEHHRGFDHNLAASLVEQEKESTQTAKLETAGT